MSTDLLIKDKQDLGLLLASDVLHLFRRDARGMLDFRDSLTEKEWASLGPVLCRLNDDVQWVMGKWLVFGEQKFCRWRNCSTERARKYALAQAATCFEASTLKTLACTYRRIAGQRHPGLSFGHHHAVAALPPPEQKKLLKQAKQQHWTRSDLRAAVRQSTRAFVPEADHRDTSFPSAWFDLVRWLKRGAWRTFDADARSHWRQLTAPGMALLQESLAE